MATSHAALGLLWLDWCAYQFGRLKYLAQATHTAALAAGPVFWLHPPGTGSAAKYPQGGVADRMRNWTAATDTPTLHTLLMDV